METFAWSLKLEKTKNVSFSSLKTSFNDGYTQRVGYGLNPIRRAWDVSCTGLNKKIDEITAFLDRHGDYTPFLWKDPKTGETIPVFLDDGYSEEILTHTVKRLTGMTFIRAYGVITK